MNSIDELLQRRTSMTDRVVTFGRYLRMRGYTTSYDTTAEALKVISTYLPTSPSQFKEVLKSVFVKNYDELSHFDEYFDRFWLELSKGVDSKEKKKPSSVPKNQQSTSLQSLKDWLYNRPGDEEIEMASFSDFGALAQKDFKSFTPTQLDEIIKILREYRQSYHHKMSLRYKSSRRNKGIDVGKTVRKMSQKSGDLMQFYFNEKKPRKQKLVLFCDVSKSMDIYAKFLIQLLYGGIQAGLSTEVFLFSMSSHRVTEFLRFHTYEETLQKLSESELKWGEGTMIGKSLTEFVEEYPSLVDKNTTIVVLSDGLDTGEDDELRFGIERISRRSRKLIWLNPLMSNPDYRPESGCMKTVMPYLDYLGGVHSIESIVEFVDYLQTNP